MWEYPALARAVESHGAFSELTVHDVVWWRPVWPILTLVAEHTERVLVGPDVTHPYLVHPAVTAQNVAALDELFRRFGVAMATLAQSMLRDHADAQDVVEEVLVRAAPCYTAPSELEVFFEGQWRCTAFALSSAKGQAVQRHDVVEAQRRQRVQARRRIQAARRARRESRATGWPSRAPRAERRSLAPAVVVVRTTQTPAVLRRRSRTQPRLLLSPTLLGA